MTGKAAPDTANPLPVTVAALTVTAEDPLEVKVTGSVAGEPIITQPNAALDVLALREGEASAMRAKGKLEARTRKRAVSQPLEMRS